MQVKIETVSRHLILEKGELGLLFEAISWPQSLLINRSKRNELLKKLCMSLAYILKSIKMCKACNRP